jgi:acetylornithine deacetylase/succinyl-diaminopimelate desuccinylase-like protein
MKTVLDSLKANRDKHLSEMIEWLIIPSISPGAPNPKALTDAADWIEQRLSSLNLDEVKQLHVEGHNPVVWGRKHFGDDLPTILFYGHYDVMPPDPLELWDSPPFEPLVKDGILYARGAADDKGQALMQVNAVEAFLAAKKSLPVNVIFAYEGEEEMGSEGLEKLLDSHKELFDCDVAVISDSPFFDRNCPSLCYGLRGIAVGEIKVKGPGRDLHSGNYGGAVANPVEVVARMVNDLKDRDGVITVEGFYDDVLPLKEDERKAFSDLPFDEAGMFADLEIKEGSGEKGYSTLERVWARPTLELNGIGGGFQGEGNKTIVPSEAFAKISCRLVPYQNPTAILDALEKKVYEIAPPGVDVEFTREHVGSPFLAPLDDPYVAAAQRAMTKGFGKESYLIRDGASIPIVNSIAEKLGATCLLIGIDVPEGKIHSPNEMLILENFYGGMETIAHLLEEIAAV